MTLSTTLPSAGAGAARAGEDRLIRWAIALTLGLFVLRLLSIGNFGLLIDEAYYWLWSTNLQPGYFDHPPAVAFVIRLGTLLFGDSAFGIRVAGVSTGLVDAALVYAISLTLFGDRARAAWAVIYFNLTGLMMASVIIVPDQAMIMFWLAALYGAARIARGGGAGWWLLVGAMAGLAVDSKYTAFFFGAGIGLWLLVVPSMRGWLLRPWPYLGAAVTGLIFLPVFLWNEGHDWASLNLQFGRLAFDRIRFDTFVEYLASPLVLLTPPILVLAAAGALSSLRHGRWRTPERALLLALTLPLAIYFAVHSFHQRVDGHWESPLIVTAVLFAPLALDIRRGWTGAVVRFAHKAAVPFGLAASLVFYGMMVESVLPIPAKYDLTARFRGWPGFAANAEAALVASGATYFVTADYGRKAMLTYHLDDPPPVLQVNEWHRWTDFPPPDPALAEETGLYVGRWNRETEAANLAGYFSSVTYVGEVERPIRDGVSEHYPLFLVSDPKRKALPIYGLGED